MESPELKKQIDTKHNTNSSEHNTNSLNATIKVYVGHRFKFKDVWPQVVAHLHEKNGILTEMIPKYLTSPEMAMAYSNGHLTDDEVDHIYHLNNVYGNGSYNYIAFEYFKSISHKYGLEIFIHNDGTENIEFVDIGLALKKEEVVGPDNKNTLAYGEDALKNIEYVLKSPLEELPFWPYCISINTGPRIFYLELSGPLSISNTISGYLSKSGDDVFIVD